MYQCDKCECDFKVKSLNNKIFVRIVDPCGFILYVQSVVKISSFEI